MGRRGVNNAVCVDDDLLGPHLGMNNADGEQGVKNAVCVDDDLGPHLGTSEQCGWGGGGEECSLCGR